MTDLCTAARGSDHAVQPYLPSKHKAAIRTLGVLGAAIALCAGSAANAVVIRHDVPEKRYLVAAETLPQLADMPGAGHGVLIAPQWVVTAAHTIQGEVKSVMIAGQARAVERIVVHPGYRSTPSDIINRALAAQDATELMVFLAQNHDIALLRLAQPITTIRPMTLYQGQNELGSRVKLIGKGASGNGLTGVAPGSAQRGALRRAYNRISGVEERWLKYSFDQGSAGLPLEGMIGSGDSGGPMLIRERGTWRLAGLVSWQDGNPDLRLPSSRYGQKAVNVRLSYYADWIKDTQNQFAGSSAVASSR
jgi:hypothetical protein